MLLGRNWLKAIKLNWGTIKKVTNDLEQVLNNHNKVFKDELGTMQDTNAKLYVKHNCNPKFCKPRSVPHTLKEETEHELTMTKLPPLECVIMFAKNSGILTAGYISQSASRAGNI